MHPFTKAQVSSAWGSSTSMQIHCVCLTHLHPWDLGARREAGTIEMPELPAVL